MDIRTGQPIDVLKKIEEFEKSDSELEAVVKRQEKLGERLRKQWTYAQFVCISFALAAMIQLVWLAIANF